jgi:hypothetical protein
VRDLSARSTFCGSIGFGLAAGESAPLPERGVAANINLASLNIDSWEAVMSSAAGVSLASTDAPGGGSGSAQGYFPTVMAVRANS